MKSNKMAKKIAIVLSSIFLFSLTHLTPSFANPESPVSAAYPCVGQAIDGGGGVGGSLCAGRYCVAFLRVVSR